MAPGGRKRRPKKALTLHLSVFNAMPVPCGRDWAELPKDALLHILHMLDDQVELLWADTKVTVPTKFIVGDGDLTYNYAGIQDYIHKGGFKDDVPLLEEVVVIPGAGHFIQQEKAQEVSIHIYSFITKF